MTRVNQTAAARNGAAGGTARVRRREPERSKRDILAAATAEFAAKGLAGARVDQIAKRARINKRMLYQYFGDKEALWLAALEAAYENMRREERLLDVATMSPREGMAALMRFNFEYCSGHPEFISLLNNENLHKAKYLKKSKRVRELYSPLLSLISDLLGRGQKSGVFRPGVDPVDLYLTIASLGYFYFSNIHTLSTIFGRDLGARASRSHQAELFVDVILRFLAP
ncbi:TetR family transcriptional regulator [Desertibaculum subflavum]|uniref:TetR family transcriptional regulator n=1 Tax=Desertibaculum subflavum TaxID=2268458 RepID=UPI000E66B54B